MAKTIENGSFRDPLGNALNAGTLELVLSQEAHEKVGGQIAPTRVTIALDGTGDVPATTILANDELDPDGTSYRATVSNSDGARVYGPVTWVLSGSSPIDLDDIIPTSVAVSAISPVPSTRLISTTAPLTGGGDLSIDRTHVLSGAPSTKGDLFTFSTAAASLPIATTDNQMLISDAAAATGLAWGTRRNRAAITAPGASDDNSIGYQVSSLWLDTTNDKAYICVDATAAAAVWKRIDSYKTAVNMFSSAAHNPSASSTSYHWGASAFQVINTGSTVHRVPIPVTGNIIRWDLHVIIAGTLDTGANTVNFWVRLNDSSDNLNIQTTLEAQHRSLSATGTIAVTAGDNMQIKLTTPASWSTSPTTVSYMAIILIEED